ncbi:unnamed protein product, partial [marine sediment metagenome]
AGPPQVFLTKIAATKHAEDFMDQYGKPPIGSCGPLFVEVVSVSEKGFRTVKKLKSKKES